MKAYYSQVKLQLQYGTKIAADDTPTCGEASGIAAQLDDRLAA